MEASSNQIPESKPMVLSVDDEVNIVRAIKRTLRRANVEVMTAESGADGLALMDSHTFDVIISDMRMPNMTGAKFLAEAAKKQPDTKRVLLTGYSDIESTIEAINEGGVSTYLTKPWDDEKLIAVVEDAVKVKQLQAKNSSLEALKAELENAVAALSESQNTIVALLGNAIGIRDKVGNEYNEQKMAVAEMMGQLIGMDDAEIKQLKTAMTLHRIGRMSLPDALLSKPYVQMDAQERELFDQHPVLAEAVLMGVPELQKATHLIRHQNEFWAGGGTPDNLSKESIPRGSAIIALVRDYFDMRAGLYEQAPMSDSETQAAIRKLSGERYSPELVQQLFESIEAVGAEEASEVLVALNEVKPGMVLARDLQTENGVLLLGKHQELDEDLLQKIKRVFKSAKPGPIYVRQ